ncbi:hypothetical protein COV82_04565 [Candidatus Peregrinibacteria bacterium CG11_big_fil_rev_8_21_14_0_20_46_8]|nr:MAG: hypothetical protein COV82_04565 [Candidatus Peregrinibacteria bacterium CG11_big_fil_rev_8_21_14_0_20_46_8]
MPNSPPPPSELRPEHQSLLDFFENGTEPQEWNVIDFSQEEAVSLEGVFTLGSGIPTFLYNSEPNSAEISALDGSELTLITKFARHGGYIITANRLRNPLLSTYLVTQSAQPTPEIALDKLICPFNPRLLIHIPEGFTTKQLSEAVHTFVLACHRLNATIRTDLSTPDAVSNYDEWQEIYAQLGKPGWEAL